MEPLEFTRAWEQRFGHLPPVVFLLKDKLASHWFAIPSPIESPSSELSESQQRVLLRAQNATLTQLLGVGATYHLVRTTVIWRDIMPPHLRDDDLVLMTSIDPATWTAYQEPGECFWNFWGKTYRWEPGALDRLLVLAAEDREPNLMLIRESFDVIISPNPRGLDVYVVDQATRDKLQHKSQQS